jgi:hypothetical protein
MSITPNTTFSWKNYTRPTPKNLLGLAAAMRRLVAVLAGTSLVLEANMWVTLGIIMLGAFLDEVKNFFAMVEEEQKIEVAEAEFPSGEQVTIIKSTPPDEPK